MKFSPTWPQVALLLGMIAAVIVTHAYAAPAVGAVTSIVSTVVGALFVNLEKKPDPELPAKKDEKGGDQ
jgi:uncharacterized membrane protein YdcZ (DUF606 family)